MTQDLIYKTNLAYPKEFTLEKRRQSPAPGVELMPLQVGDALSLPICPDSEDEKAPNVTYKVIKVDHDAKEVQLEIQSFRSGFVNEPKTPSKLRPVNETAYDAARSIRSDIEVLMALLSTHPENKTAHLERLQSIRFTATRAIVRLEMNTLTKGK